MREINENNKQISGTYGVDPALIDEAERKYKNIIGIANSPITKIEAKNAGIQVRTLTNPQSWKSNKDYHEFVAAKAIALDHIREVEQRTKDAKPVQKKPKLIVYAVSQKIMITSNQKIF